MPKARAEIEMLLDQLDRYVADDLEGQDLDFKEWDETSTRKAIRKVIASAICMANGSGGTVLFGVADRRTAGRDRALVGVPHDVDVNDLKRAVYDATDPKLTPVFEEVSVPEGTGRLLAIPTRDPGRGYPARCWMFARKMYQKAARKRFVIHLRFRCPRNVSHTHRFSSIG